MTEKEEKKYDLIYADPPWSYNQDTASGGVSEQYNTMSDEELMNMDVPAKENCILYMWGTAPKLDVCIEVLKAWGFDYKTCAIWDKKVSGIGFWFRGQHELLLVGVKGNVNPPNPSDRFSSVIREKKTKHSKKPYKVRSLLEKCYPNKSKIELFSRDNIEGWDVFGDEVPESEQKKLEVNQ